jgi:hypothetical protein
MADIQAHILVYRHSTTDLRTTMITRRAIFSGCATVVLAGALSRRTLAASPDDPVAIVNAI